MIQSYMDCKLLNSCITNFILTGSTSRFAFPFSPPESLDWCRGPISPVHGEPHHWCWCCVEVSSNSGCAALLPYWCAWSDPWIDRKWRGQVTHKQLCHFPGIHTGLATLMLWFGLPGKTNTESKCINVNVLMAFVWSWNHTFIALKSFLIFSGMPVMKESSGSSKISPVMAYYKKIQSVS